MTKLKEIPLICPCKLKTNLTKKDSYYLCNHIDCEHNTYQNKFPIYNNKPIIISEIRTDTICKIEIGKTYVNRSLSKFAKLKKFLKGVNDITENNCDMFIKEIIKRSKNPKILIIGGGEKGDGAEKIYSNESFEIHSVDIYASKNVDVICDAHYLPLRDSFYDGVWIQAVLEHVVEPNQVVKEIHRVLKTNGVVYAETPFMQPVHEGAYDFTRYTVTGHRYLFKNFSLLDMGGFDGPEKFFALSFRYLIWSITRSRIIATLFGVMLHILLRPLKFLTSKATLYDASSGVYFFGKKDNSVKIKHKDLVKLYKGIM